VHGTPFISSYVSVRAVIMSFLGTNREITPDVAKLYKFQLLVERENDIVLKIGKQTACVNIG